MQAGSPFNAFDAYVGYDPAALTLESTSVQFLPGIQFFNGGLFVNPATSSPAFIVIEGGVPTTRHSFGQLKSL